MAGVDPCDYCFDCMSSLSKRNGVCSVCGKDNQVRQNANGMLSFAFLAHKKYTVGKALGWGGFGITYVGLNNHLGKRVAIKEYFPAKLAERDRSGTCLHAIKPEVVSQFEIGKHKALTEAQTIAKVEGIPNIVRIYDCFEENNTVYIIMEYIEGDTLAAYVVNNGAMSWRDAWSLIRPIGEALGRMHVINLVHRDISPDNIMIRKEDGCSVLLDFGAASTRLPDGQRHTNLLKEGYAALEQYRETSLIDGRTDEYSWCATLYFVLTGRQPENAMQRSYNPGCTCLPRKLHSDISPDAEQALMHGMEVQQNNRYNTMQELLEALETAKSKLCTRGTGLLIAVAVASGFVCALSIAGGLAGGLKSNVQIGRTVNNACLYSKPGAGDVVTLNQSTYFSLIDTTEQRGDVWFEIRVPVEGILKTCYLSAQDAEMLSDGSSGQPSEQFR